MGIDRYFEAQNALPDRLAAANQTIASQADEIRALKEEIAELRLTNGQLLRARAHPGAESAREQAIKERLAAAHRELARRRQRDQELAAHMPAIVARLQLLAADAALDLRGDPDGVRWDRDPEIDWTGIDGGHP